MSANLYADFKTKLIESGCTRCALCGSRTQLVVDRGNPSAKVMIIGEAPGKNEDLEGKAFVGRSGRLLDQMLDKLGFDTNLDCLIANVVKCRPPDNRPPRPEEVGKCLPFLVKQIQLVKPDFILLLGATALKHLFPEKKGFSMRSQVGNFFMDVRYPAVQFMVLYHPAFILRDPRKKPLMAEHLKYFIDRKEKRSLRKS